MINAAANDIGALITQRPEIQEGRPILTGTGVAVRRVAHWQRLGLSAEAIAKLLGHVTLAQVYAALAYSDVHRATIDEDLAQDETACAQLPLCPLPSTMPAGPLRFYVDEDSLWHPLWLALRAHKADILTALAVNLIAVPTTEHLGYATVQDCVLLTFNARDYLDVHHVMHERGLAHAGVVVLRPQAASVEDVAHNLLKLARTRRSAELHDAVWRLD